ncbi:MAG: ABC transporter ATP-binding protein [Propionibacteriaceae bacterium]|jgi:multidrug/hemolysin transport system ATP-binding protein|nr:ABC transporter ATP-binding protein [Propionibacteriaceae bacterium]
MAAVSVDGLRMSYGRVEAVKGISFDVGEGAFFAFLGSNGAGKSTTINCLTTLLRPTGGQASIAGHLLGKDNDAVRRSIGVVFQNALLDPRLSVVENLALRARFHGLSRPDRLRRTSELIQLLDMGSFAKRQYRLLSGGQKRRADIARALIHHPSVLFLDEPTAGLDPRSREQVWQAISDVRGLEGMTVFLTTHYMEETERADMVCVIESGHIVAQGTPSRLRQKYSTGELSLYVSDMPEVMKILTHSFPPGSVTAPITPGDPVRLAVRSTRQVKWIMPYLWIYINDFEFRHGSMDDVFLALTGRSNEAEVMATAAATTLRTMPGSSSLASVATDPAEGATR